jgi:predicted secreted protein
MNTIADEPGQLTPPQASPGRNHVEQPEPGTAIARPHRARRILRTVVSVALIAAIFGFALPRFASYRSVWASLDAMTWPQALLVGTTAAASMASYWFMICAVLPALRLRQAAAVNLGSNAVANTLPAGGALGMGVSWAMLSSWGGRGAAVPGGHLPASYPPRRRRLPRVAARTHTPATASATTARRPRGASPG